MGRKLTLGAIAALVVIGLFVAYRASRSDTAGIGPAAAPPAAQAVPAGATQPESSDSAGSQPASTLSSASSPEPALPPARWLNIAAAALGGRIEQVSSTYKDLPGWTADRLIDGGAADETCSPVCGWSSESNPTFPQEIVLSFHQQREAAITRVVIDTVTSLTRSGPYYLPRQIEIWGSTSSATDGFSRIAAAELAGEPREHAIGFAPVRARFLKIRLLSVHGSDRAIVGEISAFEGPEAPTIVADLPHNLALPALGGGLVSFTSEYASYRASRVIDGDPASEWRSSDEHLPQEFVFRVGGGSGAFVDQLILTTRANLTTAPKLVSVAVSTASPTDAFEDVSRVTLLQAARDQLIPIGRQARFVKLRILESFGSTLFTSLGEVQLIEGRPAGYESVLTRVDLASAGAATGAAGHSTATGSSAEAGSVGEREPNNQIAQAVRLDLGAAIAGRIDPIGESDYVRISVPGPGRSVLTLDLQGRPYIRTSVSLLDRAGKPVRQFEPSRALSERASFSWLVEPGDYAVHVTEPAASVVLVWDTSGSMERDVAALQHAVQTYLDQVLPTEQVNLIRFSSAGFRLTRPDVEVLLPEFTADRGRLKQATGGKFDADGGTPFYDAVAKAMSLLEGVHGTRVIIVMTDGEDAGSRLSRQEFWQLLRSRGIRLYTVALGEINRYSLKLATTPRALLEDMAAATYGRAFFARNGAELSRFYQEISNELRTPASYRLRVMRAQATGTLQVRVTGEPIAALAAPPQIELVLDASGSMKRLVGKRPMIDTAKSVLADVVQSLPPNVRVALRVYGHRVREGQPGACQDSELVFPFATVDKPRLLARIRSIQALGTTPIAYSLQQIASDVGKVAGEKIVVLVTDGKEECGGDPGAAVAALLSQGIKVRLNVVGFALADAALKAELQKLAALTAGQFVDAQDASTLRSAIERSLAVPYDVLDAAAVTVGTGVTGQAGTELAEGTYTVRVRAEKPIDVERVRIEARQTTTIELKKEGRELGVAVVPRR
jgi:Mg-chelatase subunit ChlD